MEIQKIKKKQAIKESSSDLFLKKHVGLIHCENKLSLIQRKICNILLFNALDKINDQDTYEIPIKKLCSLVGYNSNDSKQIKDSVKVLISTVMEWNLLEDNKYLNENDYQEEDVVWNASSLLAGASIRNGTIKYSYSPQMKSVLSSLDIYGRINLFVQAKFNSAYSLVLYENCVRFKNLQQTSWFSLDILRALMGVQEGKYAEFKVLNRKVINVAVNEINQKSDIHIEPKFRLQERKVTAIQFLIKENEGYKPTFKKLPTSPVPDKVSGLNLVEVLLGEFRITKKQADNILSKYEASYIIEKINLVREKNNIDHIGAYLMSAIKNDYQEVKKGAKTKPVVSEATYLRETKKASEISTLQSKYRDYKFSLYHRRLDGQPDTVRSEILKGYEDYLKTNILAKTFYKKSGFKSPYVKSEFIVYIDQHWPQCKADCMSFDDYITSDEG